MIIREYLESDLDNIWTIFSEIVQAGETYGFSQSTSKEQAKQIWIDLPKKTFVYADGDKILGTYFIKNNYDGPGSHICNCGYMVSADARGKGVATEMCNHSQKIALELGYKAMQFNFVASSNEGAVKLWKKLGFEIVGRSPKGFNHPQHGLVDALIMYKWLET